MKGCAFGVSLLVAWAAAPSAAWAGAFLRIANCDVAGCSAGATFPAGSPVNPFGVTHPIVFQRAGGSFLLRICVADTNLQLRGPTERAIATWNSLTPTTANCAPADDPSTPSVREGCARWEEMPFVTSVFVAEAVLLHELGHCAMGLDHPERNVDVADDGTFEFTSFSRSWGEAGVAGSISAGADGIRGSSDDTQLAVMGQIANNVSWFRKSDNNPFTIDTTIIDSTKFSRSVTAGGGLPAGHSWAANGNRRVAESLGFPETQAVMYGLISSRQRYLGLTSDEVNMVKMARTGEDSLAGTADDYTVQLQVVSSCNDPHEIAVLFDTLDDPLVAGECQYPLVDFAFPQPNPMLARHYKLLTASPIEPLFIVLNQALTWDLGSGEVLFIDGFETGSTSGWSQTVP